MVLSLIRLLQMLSFVFNGVRCVCFPSWRRCYNFVLQGVGFNFDPYVSQYMIFFFNVSALDGSFFRDSSQVAHVALFFAAGGYVSTLLPNFASHAPRPASQATNGVAITLKITMF